jgi:hypothetical protein
MGESRERPVGAAPPQLFCGDIDIRIAADGTWFHEGGPIGRKPLVKLFASVLRRDETGDYWLVTPVEKARITVEDVPFIAVEMRIEGADEAQTLQFRTNLDEWISAGTDHPITFRPLPDSTEKAPYITVRERLEARLSRAVYYELIERCTERTDGDRSVLGVWSDGVFFPLDELPGPTEGVGDAR